MLDETWRAVVLTVVPRPVRLPDRGMGVKVNRQQKNKDENGKQKRHSYIFMESTSFC